MNLVSSHHARGTRPREIELDFIRGIAILLVLDFHAPSGLLTRPLRAVGFDHIGWIGVNLFFVLSGFLVGGLLVREWKSQGHIVAGRFLVRRALKIWPQYYVYIGAILLTGHRSWHLMWGNLVHLQNYVGGVPHTWTLAVEEHAYLLLVLLLAVAARRQVSPRSLFLLIASVSLFESMLRLALSCYGHQFFFMTHTSLDGISDGILLALLFHFANERFEWAKSSVWLIGGLMAFAVALLRVNPASRFAAALHIDGANLLAVASLLLLYRPKQKHSAVYRLVAAIGVYSYGIYLWHVSIMAPLTYIYGRLPAYLGVSMPVVFLIVAVMAGAAATKLIELPVLHFRDRVFPPRGGLPVTTYSETGNVEALGEIRADENTGSTRVLVAGTRMS